MLADLEAAFGTGNSIVGHFDLVAGRTGGILALGLGAGRSAREIRDLYMHRGPEIFPPVWDNILGRTWKAFRDNVLNATFHRYSRQALERVLQEFLVTRSSASPACAMSFRRSMAVSAKFSCSRPGTIAITNRIGGAGWWMSRSPPPQHRRCTAGPSRAATGSSIGGVWANNPVMLAVVEAMVAYDVPREHIKVLSIGCGDEPYHVTRRMAWGGVWQWRKIIGAAMRAQSLAATNQTRLLLGPVNVVRIEPTLVGPPIELDDYRRAMDELLPAVSTSVAAHRDRVEEMFLKTTPVP